MTSLFFFFFLLLLIDSSSSDPQTNLIKSSCHYANATDPGQFFSNLNATFADLRRNVTAGSHFATATRPRLTQPVYALFQCRLYLGPGDCSACLDAASSAALRTCRLLAGATFHYDGCFLRYEYVDFFAELTTPGQAGFCVDRTVAGAAFNSTATNALADLAAAVPTRPGSFAAVSRAVGGSGGRVYAVGECRLTVGEAGCRNCLQSAVDNVDGCLPAAEGRGVELGCFMRFSDQAFFNNSPQFDLDLSSASGLCVPC